MNSENEKEILKRLNSIGKSESEQNDLDYFYELSYLIRTKILTLDSLQDAS